MAAVWQDPSWIKYSEKPFMLQLNIVKADLASLKKCKQVLLDASFSTFLGEAWVKRKLCRVSELQDFFWSAEANWESNVEIAS